MQYRRSPATNERCDERAGSFVSEGSRLAWGIVLTTPRTLRTPILYELYDAAHLAALPARLTALTSKALFANPFSPMSYTTTGRMARAAADVYDGFTQRRSKPAWNVAAAMDVIDDRPFCRLVRFTRERAGTVPRVLLVAPLSGHHATLLRDTVATLVADHDVYVTDWVDARDVPLEAGSFGLDDDIAYVVDYLRMLGPDVHVVAVCQPAPAVLSAVALLAAANDDAQPRTMTLMGGPIDTRVAPTKPTEFAGSRPLEWFAQNVIATVPSWYRGAGRRVYPGFLQLAAFMSMNAERHFNAHVDIFRSLVRGDDDSAQKKQAFYDEYLAVMDVDAAYYLDTVDKVFQSHALPLGRMTWRGEPVEPAAIRRTALLTIEGELDDISAPGQTFAAHALCRGLPAALHDHYLQLGAGHYGIFSGSRWRTEIAPRIAAFVRAHETVGTA
jgi:poly(3-hydroxybutyrate) depolymerase